MKARLSRRAFADAMGVANAIVDRRNTIPILANVHLETRKGGALVVRSTNLDIELSIDVEATVLSDGALTVPSATLSDILKKMNVDQVDLAAAPNSHEVELSGGRSKFKLQTLPSSDYPRIEAGEFACVIELSGRQLRDVLLEVAFAVSSEETRYYLNGVHMRRGKDDRVTFVATDGHRLALTTLDVPGSEQLPDIIVPKFTVTQLISIANAAGEAPVRVQISDRKIAVTSGKTRLLSKLIDGTFPDYQRVIPSHGANSLLKVKAADLQMAVDRVSTVSTERGRAVKMTIENNQLELLCASPDHGTADDTLDVDYGGPAVSIGFNSRYVYDLMKHVGADTACWQFGDAGSPALVTRDGNSRSLFVLMPMRV